MGSDRFLPHLTCIQWPGGIIWWCFYIGAFTLSLHPNMSHHVSSPHNLTADSHLSGSPPCSSQVSFSIGQITAILHFHWKSRRCLCVKLVVNQFMHGPIPHILIHESQVKYSQKHICPCVDIYSRPLNGNGWSILGNKIHGAIFPCAWPSVVSPPTWIIVPVSPDTAKLPPHPMVRWCHHLDHSGLISRSLWSLTCFCCRRGRASHGRTQRWTRGSFCTL